MIKATVFARFIFAAFIFAGAAGCKEKTVDATTDETLKSSIQEVKASLPPEKQAEFENSIKVLAFSNVTNIADVMKLAADPGAMQLQLKGAVNGKTGEEIIAEGNRIIEERKAREREQAISEIKEIQGKIANLEQQKAAAEQAKEDLKKFEIVRSRFYFEEPTKYSFSRDAVIELTVKNSTGQPVSRAYFKGVLSSPGRSVPWVSDSFNYKIPGGLESGEEATWNLNPNMFSEWGQAPKDRKDMILTVTTIKLDGADDKPIFDSEGGETAEKEITRLNERLASLSKSI